MRHVVLLAAALWLALAPAAAAQEEPAAAPEEPALAIEEEPAPAGAAEAAPAGPAEPAAAPRWRGVARASSFLTLLTGTATGVAAVEFSFTVGDDGALAGRGLGSFVFGGAYEDETPAEPAAEAAPGHPGATMVAPGNPPAEPTPGETPPAPGRCRLSAVGTQVPVLVQGTKRDAAFLLELVPEPTPIELVTTCPGPQGPTTTAAPVLIPLPSIGPVEVPALDGAVWSGPLAAGDGAQTTLELELHAPPEQP